jgi:hypothetical protein
MKKLYTDKYIEQAIDSAIEDALDFLADDITSILTSIELDSKRTGAALDELLRSNSVLSSKLDLVLAKFYKSLSSEIKVAFGIKAPEQEHDKK